MIELTRLNNASLILNSDRITFVEQAPDTVITLVTGEKIIVRENSSEVIARVIEFRRSVVAASAQAWDNSYLRRSQSAQQASGTQEED